MIKRPSLLNPKSKSKSTRSSAYTKCDQRQDTHVVNARSNRNVFNWRLNALWSVKSWSSSEWRRWLKRSSLLEVKRVTPSVSAPGDTNLSDAIEQCHVFLRQILIENPCECERFFYLHRLIKEFPTRIGKDEHCITFCKNCEQTTASIECTPAGSSRPRASLKNNIAAVAIRWRAIWRCYDVIKTLRKKL